MFLLSLMCINFCFGKGCCIFVYLPMKYSTYCLGKVVLYLFICLRSTVIIFLVKLLYICLLCTVIIVLVGCCILFYLCMRYSTYCFGKATVYLFNCLECRVIIVLVMLLYICLFVCNVE
jgi:hypothetical protein